MVQNCWPPAAPENVGHFVQFDQILLESVNGLVGVLRVPGSLAFVMEAAGAVLEERVRRPVFEADP